ncbi:MAG TPA: tetratricopeptide repeat protein [Methylomirabilota bacterium]|nr:tetratricopeptide repeat protein [Methylomirabilota bacterium]
MRRLLPVLVGIVSVVAFLPALDGQFLTWDDDVNFLWNESYRGLGWPQIRWAFSNVRMGHYIPVTWLSLSANYVAGGMHPRGYHLVNLLLHGANAVLFFLVARRLLAAARDAGSQHRRAETALAWGAAAAALVFALHPLRVESVAWITERRDVLSGLFFLAAVLAYLRGVETGDRIEPRWRNCSLALFAGGLLSKASVMPLPAVLVLLDVYPLRRGAFAWRRLIVEKAGYWALALAGALGALVALRASGLRITPYAAYGPEARLTMVAYSFWFYPAAWAWPARLSPMYELPAHVDPLAGRFLLPVVGLLLVTGALVGLRKRWPGGLAAWLYSAIMLLPISGVVHAGFQLAHDRYSYLSGLGFALAAGGGVVWILRAGAARRVSRAVAAGALGVVILVVAGLGISSWQQSRIWRDSETLWRWGLEVDARCAVCANNLAVLFIHSDNAAQLREAEELARRALAINPAYDSAYTTLGAILARRHQDRDAEAAFRRAMELAPDRVLPAVNLGSLYARRGRYAEALPLLRAAFVKAPEHPGLRTDLGLALRNEGIAQARADRLREAEELLEEAAPLIPDDPDLHRNLGLALWEQGRSDAAAAHLERAASLRPGDPDAERLLARFRADPARPPKLR